MDNTNYLGIVNQTYLAFAYISITNISSKKSLEFQIGPNTWKLFQQYLCHIKIGQIRVFSRTKNPNPAKNGWKLSGAKKPDHEAGRVLCLLPADQKPIYDEGGCFYIAELEKLVSTEVWSFLVPNNHESWVNSFAWHSFAAIFFQLHPNALRMPHMCSMPNPLDRNMLCQVNPWPIEKSSV